MRPVILGMINPHSASPRRALWPDPPGCAGWRLWRMIHDVNGMTSAGYVAAYDRRNLLVGEWDPVRAREAAEKLKIEMAGRDVVVLGREAWHATRLYPAHPVPGQSTLRGGSTWYYLPHPSGRCQYYNDKLARWRAGRLLADLSLKSRRAA